MKEIILNPIGIIQTSWKDIENMPIQPFAARGAKGYIELLPEFEDGLKDLEGFSHVTLLYHFHKVDGFDLQVVPFMDDEKHGIYATRSPKRPNAIGISTVKIIGIDNNAIEIEDADMLDGSPLIDIKPFFPRYDNRVDDVKIGWLEKNKNLSVDKLKSDDRFR